MIKWRHVLMVLPVCVLTVGCFKSEASKLEAPKADAPVAVPAPMEPVGPIGAPQELPARSDEWMAPVGPIGAPPELHKWMAPVGPIGAPPESPERVDQEEALPAD